MMKIGVVCLLAAPLAAQALAPAPAPRAVPLADLVQEAEAANPVLLAAQHAWRAARQEPSQAGALPDPELEFSTMNVGGPLPLTGLPDQMMGYAGIGVKETFPWFGKLRLRAAGAERQAQVAKENLDSLRRKVRAEVASAYFQIAGLRQTLAVLRRDRRVLAAVAHVATERFSLGQGQEADVLRAQVEMTRLLAERTVQQQRQAEAEARLKELLNRPMDAPAITPEPLQESPLPAMPAAGLAANPALRASALETARRQLEVKLARRNFYPDLQAAYMYQATGPGFPYRSSLTVGISLPLFWRRKQSAALAAASEQEAAARDHDLAEHEQLNYLARQWILQARADTKLLHIYRDGLMPQALASWQAALSSYETGQEDFASAMAVFLNYQNLREAYWRTLAQHEIALARLREVVGPGAGAAAGATAGPAGSTRHLPQPGADR
ncbi:MAG: TolC family protein [Terriglobales bacterium]